MNVLFDLYGVLLRTQSESALRDLERAIGSGPQMWEAYWRLRPDYDAGRITDEQYWARMQRELRLEPFDYAEATRVDFEGWLQPDEEMIAYARELARTYRVGLLSNIPEGLVQEVLRQHEWLGEFASVALSCRIGVEKPQRQAYTKALEMLGARAEETLFVDDNPANIAAAREAGLDTHLFRGIAGLREAINDRAV